MHVVDTSCMISYELTSNCDDRIFSRGRRKGSKTSEPRSRRSVEQETEADDGEESATAGGHLVHSSC